MSGSITDRPASVKSVSCLTIGRPCCSRVVSFQAMRPSLSGVVTTGKCHIWGDHSTFRSSSKALAKARAPCNGNAGRPHFRYQGWRIGESSAGGTFQRTADRTGKRR